ncbi:hypothetical protein GCM10010521_57500 [Streptomyces rameus]|uniref:Major facilitator superfamily (MFS) profile domain-containing protein n=1 Tax=Streptomyces rameus TaxID=68261 RepID=A0ABN3UYR5_9ACTN
MLQLAGAAALLVLFFVIQKSVREPLMPLGIWRVPRLGSANLAMALLGAAWIPMWYFLNLYLQQVLGYGAFASGAALLPMTGLLMIFMTAITAKLLAKFGAKPLIGGGLLVLAAGLLWLSAVEPTGTFAVDVLPASLVAALGMSLAYIPAMLAAMSGAPQEQAGLASGIVNTTYQVGSALGLAALTAVATSQGAGQLGNLPALTDGFSAAFVWAAAIAAVGGLITLLVMRGEKTANGSDADPVGQGERVRAQLPSRSADCGTAPRDHQEPSAARSQTGQRMALSPSGAAGDAVPRGAPAQNHSKGRPGLHGPSSASGRGQTVGELLPAPLGSGRTLPVQGSGFDQAPESVVGIGQGDAECLSQLGGPEVTQPTCFFVSAGENRCVTQQLVGVAVDSDLLTSLQADSDSLAGLLVQADQPDAVCADVSGSQQEIELAEELVHEAVGHRFHAAEVDGQQGDGSSGRQLLFQSSASIGTLNPGGEKRAVLFHGVSEQRLAFLRFHFIH